jgi:hypothetical protein
MPVELTAIIDERWNEIGSNKGKLDRREVWKRPKKYWGSNQKLIFARWVGILLAKSSTSGI